MKEINVRAMNDDLFDYGALPALLVGQALANNVGFRWEVHSGALLVGQE